MIVQDYFGQASSDWLPEFPTLAPGSLATDGSSPTHGFDVLTTLAANFDADPLTGANPFQQCLDLRPLSVSGLSFDAISLQLSAELRSLAGAKAVVNQSLRLQRRLLLVLQRTSPHIEATGVERAYDTLTWKEATSAQWNDFAIAVAAGNERDKPLSAIYAAFGIATFGTPASLATMLDPTLTFAGQGGYFVPPADRPGISHPVGHHGRVDRTGQRCARPRHGSRPGGVQHPDGRQHDERSRRRNARRISVLRRMARRARRGGMRGDVPGPLTGAATGPASPRRRSPGSCPTCGCCHRSCATTGRRLTPSARSRTTSGRRP